MSSDTGSYKKKNLNGQVLCQTSQTEERTSYVAFEAGHVKKSNHIFNTNIRLAQIKFPAKVYDVRNRDQSPRICSNHPVDSIIRRLCLSFKTNFLEKLTQCVNT